MLIPKTDRYTTKVENLKANFMINIGAEIFNKMLSNKIQGYTKNIHCD